MRVTNTVLLFFCLILLTSCGQNEPPTENETNDAQAETVNTAKNEETNGNEESDIQEDDKKREDVPDPTGVSDILTAVAQEMGKLKGMALAGKTTSSMQMAGKVINETGDYSGRVTFDPYAQHISGQIVSEDGESQELEMYTADEKTYMKLPSEGWMVMPLGSDGMGVMLTEAHFEQFARHADKFDLSDEGSHHVLRFEGSGDTYKEIAFGGLKELWGEEAYQSMIGMFEDISGSYEFTVDKRSHRVVAASYETEITMGTGISSEDHGTYEYSQFNEVDKVTVPQEVLENAQSFPNMDSIEDE